MTTQPLPAPARPTRNASCHGSTPAATPGCLREGRVRVREVMTNRTTPDECQATHERAVDAKEQQLGVIFDWS